MLVIIQARSSSKRFKNKVLHNIFGKKILEHVICRVLKYPKAQLIVSTSKNKQDDKIVNFLKKIKIKYFRGSLNNVALRLFETAQKENQKYFLRISADSPLIDTFLIKKIIKIHKNYKNYDLITNVFPRTFPSGQSVEIIKTNILGSNLKYFSKEDKEHVTRYFYKNNKKFMIKNFKNTKKNTKLKFAIDTPNDLQEILKKFNRKKFLKYSYLNEKN